MKKLIFVSIAIASAITLNATDKASLTTDVDATGRTVEITALSDNVIKITNSAKGEITSPSKLSVLEQQPFHGRKISLGDKDLLVTPSGITITLDKTTGEVMINAGNGRGIYDNGRRGTDDKGRRTMSLRPMGDDSTWFGGGERGWDYNLAGDTLVMYNRQNYGYQGDDPRTRQMNITMPLIASPNGYALVFDDFAAAELFAGNPLEYASESPQSVSYYFVNSPNGFEGITEQLTEVTGRQDLPPFWSLGYITSKYGYKTQHETDSVVTRLKKDGYPLDGIVLDLYWYGQEQDMGRLEWEPTQWPNHKKMLSDLKKKGVNMVIISQPYVLRNGRALDNYNYLTSKGMLAKDANGDPQEVEIWVGEGGMFDVSNPDTRQWLRNRYKQLTDEGVTGWWGDLGEPEVHPEGIVHANGLTTRQYHNLYGNDWSSIIYDLFKDEYPDRRLMTLMRGGTIGLQRYSVFPWSTDVARAWGGLQPQVKIMLNAGISGLGYMSHDIGGFGIDCDNPYDPELYVRWLQMGLFTPILRTHAQGDAEPFNYPDQKAIIQNLIKERYAWLPYNYTLAYENTTKGTPLVRSIGTYTNNVEAYNDVIDQYLWGKDVMVAPVIEQGATSRIVRFPEGATWVDINDPASIYEGGTTATVSAPLNILPLYARGGALLPKARYNMENTGDYNPARYTIDYYPVENVTSSQYSIFEDDRTSPSSLEKNEYAMVDITAQNTPEAYTFTASVKGDYPGMPAKRSLTFVIHNVGKIATATVTTTIKGKKQSNKVKTQYDNKTHTLSVTIPAWIANAPLTVTLPK